MPLYPNSLIPVSFYNSEINLLPFPKEKTIDKNRNKKNINILKYSIYFPHIIRNLLFFPKVNLFYQNVHNTMSNDKLVLKDQVL